MVGFHEPHMSQFRKWYAWGKPGRYRDGIIVVCLHGVSGYTLTSRSSQLESVVCAWGHQLKSGYHMWLFIN